MIAWQEEGNVDNIYLKKSPHLVFGATFVVH